jgi:hypothetical protein
MDIQVFGYGCHFFNGMIGNLVMRGHCRYGRVQARVQAQANGFYALVKRALSTSYNIVFGCVV